MRRLAAAVLLITIPAYAQVFGSASQICSLNVEIKDILSCNLDGNEFEDILLSPYVGTGANMIVIMNGSSGFSEPQTISWTGNNMRAADFNGDGLDDIATGHDGPLLFSNGDGTFTPSTYDLLSCTVPEDFNNDGMPDLLMGSGTDIYLALNQNWAESFETVWSGTVPSWPGVHSTGFITGNIAGDSYTDFAALHSYGLRVFIAQGGCSSFTMSEDEDDLYTYLSGSPPYAQCDVNNDGHPDLLHSGWDIYPSPPPPIYMSFWEDAPGAWYWTLSAINANHQPTVEGCDFNGDGYDEILYSNTTAVTVLEGSASGPGPLLFSDSEYDCGAVGYGHLAGGANPDLISASLYCLYWFENSLTSVEQSEWIDVDINLCVSENPFSSSVSITSPFQGTFQILDCSGRTIGTASGSVFNFAPEDLPAGSYILVFTGMGRTIAEKLVYLPR